MSYSVNLRKCNHFPLKLSHCQNVSYKVWACMVPTRKLTSASRPGICHNDMVTKTQSPT